MDDLQGWLSENSDLLAYDLQVHVSAPDDHRGYTLELAVIGDGRRLHRRLFDPSCGTVIEAAALITAVFIEPEVLNAVVPPAQESSPPAEAVPAAGDPAVARTPAFAEPTRPRPSGDQAGGSERDEPGAQANKPRRRPSDSRRRAQVRRLAHDTASPPAHRWSTEISAQADSGIFSPTAAHLGLGLRWHLRAFSLRTRLTVQGPSVVRDRHTPGRSIVGVAASAQLDTCFVPGRNRVRTPLCASIALAPAWARGTGVANAQTRGQLTWGAGLETGLEIDLSPRVYLGVCTRVGVVAHGAHFALADRSLVLNSRWWSLRGGLYVGMRWPRGRRGR